MPDKTPSNPIAAIEISDITGGVAFINAVLKEPKLNLLTEQIVLDDHWMILVNGEERDIEQTIASVQKISKIKPGSLSYTVIDQPHSDLTETITTLLTKEKPITGVITTPVTSLQEEVIRINQELFNGGYITAVGGNVSARIPEQPDTLWITPSSIYKGSLKPEQLVRINLDGEEVGKNMYRASSERYMHSKVMRQRPEINSVIHSHSKFTTVLTLTGLPFLPLSGESCFTGEMHQIPYIPFGTHNLADAVAEALRQSNAVLMQNHGVVVAARSLRSAADLTMIIEENAQKIITCYLLGIPPTVLPQKSVEEYRKMGEIRG